MQKVMGTAVLVLFAISTALAQSGVPEKVLFEFRVDGSSTFQSVVRSDLSDRDISLGKDLDMRWAWGPQARFIWKMSDGNRFRFDLNRVRMTYKGETVIDRDIEFPGDIEFPVSAYLESEAKNSEIRFAYSYLFKIGTERFRVGPLVDVRWLEADVTAKGAIGGIELGSGLYSGAAWGGTIGAEFDSYPTDSLNFYGFADWIGAGDLDGSWDIETGIRYFFKPWFGVTLAYEYSGNKLWLNNEQGFIRVQSNNIAAGVAFGF